MTRNHSCRFFDILAEVPDPRHKKDGGVLWSLSSKNRQSATRPGRLTQHRFVGLTF